MKVIFLDIDGVLVNRWSRMQGSGMQAPFDPTCLKALNRIICETGAYLVVTSTWRREFSKMRRASLNELLATKGVRGTVLDSTPVTLAGQRIEEILGWLVEWKEENEFDLESFVILDDDPNMKHLRHLLVRTNGEVGLTEADSDKAIAILNTEEPPNAQ